MATIQDALRIVLEAEAAVRSLAEAALREQRYSEVAEIARLAGGLAKLSQGLESTSDNRVLLPAEFEQSQPGEHSPRLRKRSSRASKSGYPRFIRDDDRLVKIGWSKKKKAAYEHRAPRDAVLSFIRHLRGAVAEGKVFVVEDLMPVPDIANGGEIPAYQVYLTLAWLRFAGVVEKKGRDGYTLRRDALSNGHFEELWASLGARPAG